MAENSKNKATTIQAFMITSLLSKYKDVVALFPVCNLTADLLLTYANNVLSLLHECGFIVFCLISDNNRINRNMFINMCGGETKPYILNPYCPGKKLFFLFDSVHLIKAIRNNWINQTGPDQKIYFPDPFDKKILFANLNYLKEIYEKEKNSVVKSAPKLSQKVLYPNSIERQNVTYALNLFDSTNCAALEMIVEKLGDNVSDTKLFIDLICKWWKVMNVKNPSKGKHLNDPMSEPIKSIQDDNFMFLIKFHEWLTEWDKLYNLKAIEKKNLGIPTKGGILSKETFFALKFTSNNIIEVIKYIFETIGSSYVLLGKFQTDSLEAHFGQYRQMSGGNFNVSCMQVIEAESKLKILNLISMYSENCGEFQIKDLKCILADENIEETEIPGVFYETFNSSDDIEITTETLSVLIFIGGYVAHKTSNKLKCSDCITLIVKDKTLDIDCPEDVYKYLMIIDRGHLKWPQDILSVIIVNAFQIFQKLINVKYEDAFLKFSNPKNLLMQLTIEKSEIIGINFSDACKCGNTLYNLIKQCLSGISNIFLNNYTKVRNDVKKFTGTKRKLSILVSSEKL